MENSQSEKHALYILCNNIYNLLKNINDIIINNNSINNNSNINNNSKSAKPADLLESISKKLDLLINQETKNAALTNKLLVLYDYFKAKDKSLFKKVEDATDPDKIAARLNRQKKFLQKKDGVSEGFNDFWKNTSYPKRPGDQKFRCKSLYERLINAGFTHQNIFDCCERYAKANVGNKYTYALRNFLGKEAFQDHSSKSAAELSGVDDQEISGIKDEIAELNTLAEEMDKIGSTESADKLRKQAEELKSKISLEVI